jgi:hypothetical protein
VSSVVETCSKSLQDQELKLSGSVMKEINRGRKNLIAEFESLTENFGTYVR